MKTSSLSSSPCIHARKAGFSLIEILVSIAVIAILATVLIPVLGTARNRSLSAKDGVQLRGWGMEWLLMNQAEGRVRHWASGTRSGTNPAQYWTYYLASAQPSWTLGVNRLKDGRSPMYEYDSTWNASEFYGFVLSYNPGPGRIGPPADGNASDREYTMEFADAEVPSDVPWMANSFNGRKQTHTIRRGAASAGSYHLIHDGAANVMFLDGHLEQAKPDRLYDLGVREAWTKDGEIIQTINYKDQNEND